MQDSSDDDAAPEEPSLESSASPSIRMSLNMGSLTSSGSNLFKEEDAAIKGGEVTLNFTDEAAGKEFRLNVRRQMPPRVHPDPHSHSPRACRLAPSHRSSPWARQSNLSRPRSRTSGNGSMSGPTRQWRCVCLAARDPRLSGQGTPAPHRKCAPAVPQGVELVFDGTAMMDPMSLSDVAGIEAGKTVSIIMKRK